MPPWQQKFAKIGQRRKNREEEGQKFINFKIQKSYKEEKSGEKKNRKEKVFFFFFFYLALPDRKPVRPKAQSLLAEEQDNQKVFLKDAR